MSTPSPIGPFQVSYSGESILFSPQDAQGHPLPIAGVRGTDDIQILGLAGVPGSSSFTLSLSGQVTAPIALQPIPALTAFVWSATLPASGTYDLSYFFGYAYGTGAAMHDTFCPDAVIQVRDGATLVGTVALDQSKFPGTATDLNVPNTGVFRALGSFSFASTNLSISLTGPAGTGMLSAGTMRVAPHGGTDATKVGYIDPSPNPWGPTGGALQGATGTTRYGAWTLDTNFTNNDGSGRYQSCYFAPAAGSTPAGVASPADIQAALLGLSSSVPAGAVSVAAIDSTTCSVHFAGTLANRAMATLVPSDPAIKVTHDDTGGSQVGGQFPSVTFGGSTYQLRAFGFDPSRPTMMFHLIQSPNPIRIRPTDVVTFDAPAGFVSVGSGPLPAARSIAVAPAAATRMPALDAKVRTMKLGFNCNAPTYYAIDSLFSNLAIQTNTPVGSAPDVNGYPTRLAAPEIKQPLTQPHLGAPNCDNGTYVLQWSSASGDGCSLGSNSSTGAVVEDTDRRVVGPINRRYYNITETVEAAPLLALILASNRPAGDGSYLCDIRDVAVYSPDVDPANPGRWRPGFLAKLKGMHCFRFMDLFGTNNMGIGRFEHFPDPATFPFGYGGRTLDLPIATIGPPTPDPFCEGEPDPTVLRVTTAAPHDLVTGMMVTLRTTDKSSLGQVASDPIAPTARVCHPFDPTAGYPGVGLMQGRCRVIDPTTIQVAVQGGNPASRMTNTLTPSNGVVHVEIGGGAMFAPSDAAQLCADANLDAWVNIPWLADDDCVARMARAFAAKLPVGRLVHLEYGNEGWNYEFSAYDGGQQYCQRMDLLGGGSGYWMAYYIKRMGEVHQLFRAAWQQAGRDVNDVRRVCGAQQSYISRTTDLVNTAIAAGITFDELAPASYLDNVPVCGAGDDLLTREQLLDVMALNVLHDEVASQMRQHVQAVAALASAHPELPWLGAVELVNYEGGPSTMVTPTMSVNIGGQNHGVHRHPGFFEILLYWLQGIEDAGVRLFNIFTLHEIGPTYQWGVYEGFAMLPGTGDATLDVANVADFENLRAIKSETGGALRQWLGLMGTIGPILPIDHPDAGGVGGRFVRGLRRASAATAGR